MSDMFNDSIRISQFHEEYFDLCINERIHKY